MYRVTVRRHQGNATSSGNDFVVQADELKPLRRQLRSLLEAAQAERGTGVWSNADPEIWIGNFLVGRLDSGGDVAQLVGRAIDELKVSAAPSSERSV